MTRNPQSRYAGCPWEGGTAVITGDMSSCAFCGTRWDTGDEPKPPPCITSDIQRNRNTREHRMIVNLDGSDPACTRCGAREYVENGVVVEMRPCWPKHGWRFLFMCFMAAIVLFAVMACSRPIAEMECRRTSTGGQVCGKPEDIARHVGAEHYRRD